MFEGDDMVFLWIALVDEYQFDRIELIGNLRSLSLENCYAFFALSVTENELPKHQKPDAQMNQDVATSIAKQKQ